MGVERIYSKVCTVLDLIYLNVTGPLGIAVVFNTAGMSIRKKEKNE